MFLSDVQSGLLFCLVAAGAAVALPVLFRKESNLHRSIALALAGILSLRYALWRATDTIPEAGLTADFLFSLLFLIVELGAMASALSTFVMLSRTRSRTKDADLGARWWEPDAPKVAVLIATYNEERDILERTIIGAKAMDYPRFEVVLCDDGKRDWLRDYCAAQGVRYLRRNDNAGAKAGNMNNAVAALRGDADPATFFAVLDADFVPHRDFLRRCMALFGDHRVGLVQTPQHFFNPDPIQHNLGLARSYPDEQRFFFDHIQASRDAWGIAFCCGTSSVVRDAALRAAGDFPTESITEDFMLTLTLRNAGWDTVYLNEALTEGLAPEGLREYVTQRARWCLGMMQIARSSVGPFRRSNLRLRDRWSVLDATFYWLTTFPFRMAAVSFPLLYWFFNITVVDADLASVLRYFGPYFIWTFAVLSVLTSNTVVPIVNDVSQLLGAMPITKAAFVGLAKPKGHPFRVTAKGGDRSRVIVQWPLILPLFVALAVSVAGLLVGIAFDRFAYNDAGDGKVVVLVWTVYNIVVIGLTCLAGVELPRFEEHIWDKPTETVLHLADAPEARVWVTDLTRDTLRIRGKRLASGLSGEVELPEIGRVSVRVVRPTNDGGWLRMELADDQYERLIHRLHTAQGAPGTLSAHLHGLLADTARRLAK